MPFVPIEWLSEHVTVPQGTSAAQLAADLVKVGLEEEAIHTSGVTGPLVCGKVVAMSPEPQSNGKTINYCRVDVGEYNDAPGTGKEPSELPSRSIVCGAHNFKVGDHVVVSLPGAVLPGDFAISARKTYGHISDGMICSQRELGLGEDHSGIIVLEQYLGEKGIEIPPVGTDMLGILGLGEELLEINITPDRGYCFSMRGVAREYAHSTGAAFTDPGLPENSPLSIPAASAEGFKVEVNDQAPIYGQVGCDRFVTLVVRGIDPAAPSPDWMVKRLEAAGMRSLSLAVDVTNYIMLDLGQPMHAYDLDKISGPIVVRRARAGEKHVTLDEVERTLHPEDLLITDCLGGHGERVLGIAGVMGGADTEVTDGTVNVLLEAAHFDPVSVARSSRRHKLPTEAAKRFERGVDPQLPPVAVTRAAALLAQYGGASVDSVRGDVNAVGEPLPIEMSLDLPRKLIGFDYDYDEIKQILTDIGCTVKQSGDSVTVIPPSWRPDLVGGAHLVEEIARLHGYDEIPDVVPTACAGKGLPAAMKARREVARTLAEAGLVEVLSYPFIGDAHDKMGLPEDSPQRSAIRLANPLSEDAPKLRTQVIDTLLDTAARNVSRGNPEVAVFEISQVVSAEGVEPAEIPSTEQRPSEGELKKLRKGVPQQPWHVGIVLSGPEFRPGPLTAGRNWEWSDAIALAFRIASTQGLQVHVEKADRMPFHPGRAGAVRVGANSGGKVLGYAGELHPKVCEAYGLPARSCAVEFDLTVLEKARSREALQVDGISTFPAAKEDFAFVVDAETTSLKVEAAIAKAAGDMAEEIRLFDVYTGDQLGEGKKSLAFALRLRSSDKTLSSEEILQVRERVIKQVEKTCKATLRA